MFSRCRLSRSTFLKVFCLLTPLSDLKMIGVFTGTQINQNYGGRSRRTSLDLACENIRFSSLFAAGDVSRGGTSATQRQKFHTDDANYAAPLVSKLFVTVMFHLV